MSQPFRYPYTIGLHDTDAAGILFSGSIFRICNVAYEAMLEKIGYGLALLFERRTMSLPVVHLEADFKHPMTPGQRIEIVLRVLRIGRTSYRVGYELTSPEGECLATAASVHVCVDVKNRRPMDIPVPFRRALETYA